MDERNEKLKLEYVHIDTLRRYFDECFKKIAEDAIGIISPAPVSDEKPEWVVSSQGNIYEDGMAIGKVFDTAVDTLRTLIAREKLCEKMYEWMCKYQKHTKSSLPDPEMPWLNSGRILHRDRDTLIAEYEEANK